MSDDISAKIDAITDGYRLYQEERRTQLALIVRQTNGLKSTIWAAAFAVPIAVAALLFLCGYQLGRIDAAEYLTAEQSAQPETQEGEK